MILLTNQKKRMRSLMKFKFYDTCSLLEQAGNLFTSDDFTLVISSITLEELEHIKSSNSKDPDVKFAARRVLAALEEHYEEYIIQLHEKGFDAR